MIYSLRFLILFIFGQQILNAYYTSQLKDQLGVLMKELEIQGFFDTDNDSIDWVRPPVTISLSHGLFFMH
jgi:hypothetical protein